VKTIAELEEWSDGEWKKNERRLEDIRKRIEDLEKQMLVNDVLEFLSRNPELMSKIKQTLNECEKEKGALEQKMHAEITTILTTHFKRKRS